MERIIAKSKKTAQGTKSRIYTETLCLDFITSVISNSERHAARANVCMYVVVFYIFFALFVCLRILSQSYARIEI